MSNYSTSPRLDILLKPKGKHLQTHTYSLLSFMIRNNIWDEEYKNMLNYSTSPRLDILLKTKGKQLQTQTLSPEFCSLDTLISEKETCSMPQHHPAYIYYLEQGGTSTYPNTRSLEFFVF